MNKKILLGSLFLSISYGCTSFADVQCITGSASSSSLVDQLEKAKTSNKLTQIIYQKYDLIPKTEANTHTGCADNSCPPTSLIPVPAGLQQTRSAVLHAPEAPILAFKQECLEVSNKSSSATAAQISCPGGSSGKGNMCVTSEQLKYQNAVISSFVNCATKEGLGGIDLDAIFQKLSIESGFRPQYSSGNGTGIGQLTGIFVDDVFQKGRGFERLKKIADSTSPDCEAAKIVASADIKSKPKFSDKCAFISTGDGFERNILYGLIGTATAWAKNLEPKLRGYLNKYRNDPAIEDVKKFTIMNAYGSGGNRAAAAAARRLSSFSPAEFVKRMQKPLMSKRQNLTQYTSNIKKRQDVIGKNLPEPIKSEFAKIGADACINRF